MSEEQVGPSAGVDTKQDSKRLQYSNCVYTSCYCEENVWKLCQQIKKDNGTTLKEYHVVFISNKKRQVPLWMQKKWERPTFSCYLGLSCDLDTETRGGEAPGLWSWFTFSFSMSSWTLYPSSTPKWTNHEERVPQKVSGYWGTKILRHLCIRQISYEATKWTISAPTAQLRPY